ncbi:hypothetical protein VD0002_g3038 [Verticillium dahliae]|uniref:SRPBCC domain-containing protein n=1 Tax=Verticillium dahliae TaxID=27337 RepID=A0AA44WBK5_VERDA|nr:Glucan endo-1,3-beta-glucosidase [Verticillium dahliae VDG2]KAH6691972.1 hypothetical protein EV126DRAFT_90611 [Verticillium dahliae]PNH28571.1 hypothetical protein BJF96_g8136 [Verticillium dahliae]PNH42007.1 hypothetical protein VD0004_g5207 [Verticillium dahliae]PNH52653.1 hypothetical protein VD0003_g4709 [Verticillium dahliae]
MGVAITQAASIEIQASPETVRSIFLDFARYNQWQDVFDIQPATTGQSPVDLKKGDNLRVNMQGFTFRPHIEANKQDVFTWVGSIPPLLWGTHHFLFTPSTKTPGGTTFVQREDFEGLLAVPFWPWRHSFKPSEPWARFNAGLKREAERVSGRG